MLIKKDEIKPWSGIIECLTYIFFNCDQKVKSREVAMAFLEEKAGELVLNAAIKKVADYKGKKQWQALFVDTN